MTKEIDPANSMLRILFVFSYMFFAIGLVIDVLTKADVNYMHIFELQ